MLKPLLLLMLIISLSCMNDKKKPESVYRKTEKILKEIATSYIKERREEIPKEPFFVNVKIKKDDFKKDYYDCVIYLSTILFKESEQVPSAFMQYEFKGKNVVYFFDENIPKEEKDMQLYKMMEAKGLIKSQYKIDENEGSFMVNDIEAWNLFICKNNINTWEIIKSNYKLEEEEKPQRFCN